MKTKLTFLLIIFFYISALNANAQTDTLRVSDSIPLSTGAGFITSISGGSNTGSAGVTYNGKLYSIYEAQPFTRQLLISNNNTVKRINPPTGYSFSNIFGGFGGNLYVELFISGSSQLAKIDANDNITIIPIPVALGSIIIVSNSQESNAVVFQNKIHFIGYPTGTSVYKHYSYDGANFQLYTAPTGLAAAGTFFAYNDTLFSRYKTTSLPVSYNVSKTVGTTDIKIDNPSGVISSNVEGAFYWPNGEDFQGINSKGLYCPLTYTGPGLVKYNGIMKYANGQMTLLPRIPNQNPDDNFHGFITFKDTIFLGVGTFGISSNAIWGKLYKIEADTLKIVSDIGSFQYPLIYNNKLQYGTEYSINPAAVGTQFYTYHDGIVDTILPPTGHYIKLDNPNNKIVFKNNFYYNTLRSSSSTAKFALIKYDGINNTEVADPLQATITTDGRGPSGRLTVNNDALIVQYEAKKLVFDPFGTSTPTKFYFSQVYKSCIPVSAISTASNKTLCAGVNDTTTISYSGTADSFEWYKNGTLLAGQTTASLILNNVTALNSGTYYLKIISTCKVDSTGTFTIIVNNAPLAPTASAQTVCAGSTLSNLTPVPSASVRWYTSASGGIPLASSTAINTNNTYYIDSVNTNGCISAIRTSVNITVTAVAPPTSSSLVIYTGTKTLSQLNVPGTNVQFYANISGGTAIPATTLVNDDSTYYVTQTQNGCESNQRKQITVNRIADDSTVVCSPATVAGLTATPQTGNTANWFTTATGGTALASTSNIPIGTNTYYVEESDSTMSTLFNYNVAGNLSFLIALTLDENDSIYYDTYFEGEKIYRSKPDGTGSTLIYQGSTTTTASINSIVYEKDNSNRYLYFATTNTLGRLDINTSTRTLIDSSSAYFPMNQISRDAANNKLYFASNRRVYVKNLSTGVVTALDSVPSAFSLIASYFSPSTNSLYFGDYQTGKVYRKNLATGVRTDSISVLKSRHISQMPDGRIIIVGEGSIVIANPDLTNPTTVATSTSPSTVFYAAQPDSKGNIIFIEPFAMKKLTLNKSNRVPVRVIVNPTPNVLPTADTIVCNGSTIPAINFATTTSGTVTYNWTNDNTSIGLAASGTGNITSFVATNFSTLPVATTATIIVTPTITNAGITCEGVKDTFLIVVNPTLGVRVIPNQVVCNGSPTTAVSYSGPRRAVVTIVYNWTNNTPSIGLAASGSGVIPSFTAINNGNAPVTATIVVTPNYTNNGVSCDGTPRTFTITVNPTATVDTIANQIICNGANTTAINFSSPTSGGTIVYNWTNDDASIGLATSGTDSIASFVATNSGTAAITATITITPTFTNGGRICIGTPRIFTITVNPTATVNSITNKVECNGSVVAAVTPTTPNTGGTVTYAWVNNNTAIGLAASGTGTIPSFTATNTGTTPITATITITPTFTNGAVSCVGTDFSYTITVNPPPIFNTIVNQVACNGSSTSVVPFSTSLTGGTSAFAWTNNNTAIGLAASGTGSLPSFTATNNTNAPISGTISVVMTYTNAGLSCVSLPQTFTYTVNPTANVSLTNDAIVCNGATVPAANFSTTAIPIAIGSTVTYSWTNDNTSIGLAASGTGNITSFTAVNTGTSPSTATIIVTPTFTNAGVSCVGVKDTFFVTVNPTVTVNTVSNQVVCNGSAVSAVNFGTTAIPIAIGSTTAYAWSNNTTSIGLAASGTGNIASFTATNTGTAPVTATISVTPTFTNAGVSCVGTSTTFTITVNPTVTVNTIANQIVCNGSAVSAVNFGTTASGGTTTYAWTNNTTSIGLAASGTGNIATFNAVNTGATPVTATITVTPTFTNAGTSCTGVPKIFTITVNPTATVSPISNKVECNGSVVAAVTPSSPNTGGAITYTWANNNTAIGLAASGTGTIPSFTATNTGTSPITATITVTPTFTNGSVSCVGTNLTYTITVNPPPIFNTVANQAACNGAVTSVVNFSTALTGGTSVFTWTNSNTAIGLAASGTGSLPSFTATNNTTAPISGTISVVMTYTNAGLSCISLPQIFTYTVNPTATVNTVANQVVCNNSPITAVNFTSATTGGSIVYNWTNNTPSIGLAATGTGNIASFTAVNTTTTPVIATITVTPSYSNAGVTCVGTSRTYTITVNPTATVNAIANQVVCNNSPTTAVTFSSPTSGGTIVYNWTNNTTSIGLAASGTGNIASFTAVNTGTAPVTATITVTPSYSNGGVTCVGTPSTYTYTVNPTATVTPITSQVICNGSPTTAVTFSSPTNGGTIVYNWTNNTPSIGLAATGSGNIASFNAVNTGTAPVIATITVTPSYTNGGVTCVGTPTTYTYTVNPTATVNVVANQVVCNLSPTTAVTFSSPTIPIGIGSTIVYNWTNTTTSIGLAASGTGNIASFTATNTTTAPVTATITVTPSYTNAGVTCVGTPRTFTITVNPTATVNPVANQVLCNNFPTTAVTFSSPTTGGTIVFNWTNSTPSIGLAASGSGNIASFTATNTTQVPVVATITVTPSYTNAGVTCVGTPLTFTITVNPTPIVTLAAFAAICKNAAPITLTGGSPVAGTGTTGVYLVDNVAQTVFNPANYTPGLHTIVYVYTNQFGCVNSATQTILVHPIHAVEITVASNAGVSPYTPITVVASVSPAGNYTYVWRKNGVIVTGANADRITVLANDAGTYNVTVTAPTGCIVVSANAITPSATLPNILFAFPNPSTGIFNVSYNNGEPNPIARTLMVYDSKGARVFSQSYSVNVPYGNMKVDISKYAKGLYYVVLNDSNGKKLASTAVEKL